MHQLHNITQEAQIDSEKQMDHEPKCEWGLECTEDGKDQGSNVLSLNDLSIKRSQLSLEVRSRFSDSVCVYA